MFRHHSLLIFFLWLFLLPATAQDLSTDPARVLVLHAYHQGFRWSDSVQRGIRETFAAGPLAVELDVEYLDTKRHPTTALFSQLAALFALKFRHWQPGLILCVDDDALAFLFEYRERLFPGIPVIFGGLNVEDYDPALLAGRPGYTGVVERLDLASTIDLILQLQPKVREIIFVHDRTSSGLADRRTIEALLPDYVTRVDFVFPDTGSGLSEAELLAFLGELEADAAVYFLGFFRDRLDKPLAQDHIIPLIAEAAGVPVYSHAEDFLGHGIFGGKLLSGEVHGRAMASKALRIFQGTPVTQLPVTVESSNRYIFDDRQRRRFGISIAKLPPGSLLRFQPTSFFRRHRTAILWAITGLAVLLSLTVGLAVNTVRRRRVEQRLAESERNYRLLIENQTDLVVKTDSEGRLQFVSPSYCRTFGQSERSLLGRSFLPLVHPEDREATERAMGNLHHPPYTCYVEQRAMTVAGWRWLAWSDTAVHDELGRLVAIIGVGRDITERVAAEERVRHLAEHDALTGLPGLRLARDRLDMAIRNAQRKHCLVALLFVDLDGFKAVNDGHGHDAGDFVLREVAARFKASVRASDTVARIGGDELLVIMGGMHRRVEAEAVAGKLIDCLAPPIYWEGHTLRVGASIGIAVYPDDGDTTGTLIRLADRAMYRVKHSSKNAFAFANT